MTKPATCKDSAEDAGRLLQDLVNRISHQSGVALTIMNEAAVTLPQVMLLVRLNDAGQCAMSDLAQRLAMSLPAVSQMVDRLVPLGLVSRSEDPDDRRRKLLAATRAGKSLLERIAAARSADYAAGLAALAPARRKALMEVLRAVLDDLDRA